MGSQLLLDTVEVALPTETFWPVLPEGVEMTPGGDARIVGGGFTETLSSVSGLGMGAQAIRRVTGPAVGQPHLAPRPGQALVLAHGRAAA